MLVYLTVKEEEVYFHNMPYLVESAKLLSESDMT